MDIIFDEELRPANHVIENMKTVGEYTLELENVDKSRAEVSVIFVGPEEIRELNRIYRNTDKITDVLSFPQYEEKSEYPKEGIICLGDVVICPDQAFIQADEYGHSNERELVYLFVHSMLHLLGYDHMEDGEKKVMRQEEEKIMNHVGILR